MTLRGLWLTAVGVAVAVGVVVCAAAVPTPVLLLLLLLSGVAGAGAATNPRHQAGLTTAAPQSPVPWVRPVTWAGGTAVGVVAVVGLALLSTPLAVVVIAALGATSPWLLGHLTAPQLGSIGGVGGAQRSATVDGAPRGDQDGPTGGRTGTQLALMNDQDLCRLWIESSTALRRSTGARSATAVSAVRAQYLDEMARRDPEGFTWWITAAPHADPALFLRSHPRPYPDR